MTHMFEAQHLMAPPQDEHAESSRSDVWLGESAPEDFLREVEGFLREAPDAPEPKTGDTSAES